MSIENIAEKYNRFQNNFGQNVEQDYDAFIESLFSPESTKTANGQVLVASRGEFKGQLTSVRDMAGSWTMDIKYVIESATDQNYVIRYMLVTEKLGDFDVMALLGSLDGVKIDFIDKVNYQII
jgi:hypothetical protein